MERERVDQLHGAPRLRRAVLDGPAEQHRARKRRPVVLLGCLVLALSGRSAGQTYSHPNAAMSGDIQHTTAQLSMARPSLVGTSCMGKAFFVGSRRVDVYDGQADAWSTLDLPVHRNEYISIASVGELVLFAGGYLGDGFHSDRVDIYNVATGAWDSATLSVARSRMAAVTVGDKVIFAGGWVSAGGNSNVVDIYDASDQSWTTTTLPTTFAASSGVAAGTKAFFVDGNFSGRLDIYDVATGEWSTAALSVPRTVPACASIGSKVLFAGGYTYSGSRSGSDVVDIYDIDADTWTTASLTYPRWNFPAATLGNKVLFAGGAMDRGTWVTLCSDVVDVYDAESGDWSIAPYLSVARCQIGAASLGDVAIFAGGDREWGSAAYDVADIYTPEPTALALLAAGPLLLCRRRVRGGKEMGTC